MGITLSECSALVGINEKCKMQNDFDAGCCLDSVLLILPVFKFRPFRADARLPVTQSVALGYRISRLWRC